jgi:hypothetical protein
MAFYRGFAGFSALVYVDTLEFLEGMGGEVKMRKYYH